MTDIADTLKERGKTYGAFISQAALAQSLKEVCRDAPKWGKLACDQKEAIEMVMHKVARILNGDPDFHDSWHDISGYVKLVADRILGTPK